MFLGLRFVCQQAPVMKRPVKLRSIIPTVGLKTPRYDRHNSGRPVI